MPGFADHLRVAPSVALACLALAIGGCESSSERSDADQGERPPQDDIVAGDPLFPPEPGEPDMTNPPPPVGATGGRVTESNGFLIRHDDWARLGYRWDWGAMPVLSRRGRVVFLEAYDDVVVAQASSSAVTVLESNTGAIRWSSPWANPLTKFVGMTRAENTLLVSSESELYLADIQTGNLIDRQSLSIVVNTQPLLAGNLVIYGTPAGHVLAHLSDMGLKLWAYGLGTTVTARPVLIGESSLGAVSQAGDVLFVDAQTGSGIGRNKIAGGLANNPVADDGRMYIASLDQSVYAFNAFGGAQAWRYRTAEPITSQPTVHDGVLYVSLADEGLTAFDSGSGQVLWSAPTVMGDVVGMNGDRLLVWGAGMMYLVDPGRGDVMQSVSIPGVSRVVTDAFENGHLYIVGDAGSIIRFRPR